MAWTAVGDMAAFHVLAAYERDGYAWRTVASLSEPGIETDRWIGNVCLTESGRRAVVVYAPRAFTNERELFRRGAFTAVVDMVTGAVTKVPVRSTLAYFSPGCGHGESAVITQTRGGSGGPSEGGVATRLLVIDAVAADVVSATALAGQVTSAIPTRDGIVAAAGRQLVAVGRRGEMRSLASAASVPFHLAADAGGGAVFMEHAEGTGYISRLTAVRQSARVVELARGELTEVGIAPSIRGRVFVTGQVTRTTDLPASVRMVDVPKTAELSTDARLAILHPARPSAGEGKSGAATPSRAWTNAMRLPRPEDIGRPRPLRLRTKILSTGDQVNFAFTPGVRLARRIGEGADEHPLSVVASRDANRPQGLRAPDPATNPVDSTAWCAVPRNDPNTQVYQPTPRQVEWAVDQAVVGNLTTPRPTNWKESGLSSWSPQGMFPPIPILGGGRVPAQVMLGILAQESNLWQASYHALPGLTGNPLIGNFYGRPVYDEDESDDWEINFPDSDCGYGVAQVTDGMRKAGYERPGHTALPSRKQRALAIDYATNIAAGLRILQKKWNQTYAADVIHSDGDPRWLENWFPAIWAYNSGFHPKQGDGSPWGLGWLNNPANPIYPANRSFFNEDPHDPAHPQDWPYPEKVIGFAAYSIAKIDGPGFRPAWWVSGDARERAKPPIYAFCYMEKNDCDPGGSYVPDHPDVDDQPAGPCAHQDAAGLYDLRCWWHHPFEFNNCEDGYCGHELHRFDETYPEQPDGTNYPSNCSSEGLPSGTLIVDDVPDSVDPVSTAPRPCSQWWESSGTFRLRFAADNVGNYASKIDFHQIGGGFGGHFWFAHTRTAGGPDAKMKVTGTWTLGRQLNRWARVLVHMPDHGAHTQQAHYRVNLGTGATKSRYLLQRTMEHRWVSLGVFRFAGTPSVSLSAVTRDGDGSEDVAWDAIAFQPLPAKPRHMVVALGDSYTSGEGASNPDGDDDYYNETDNNGDNAYRNACHRSPHAWPRRGTIPGTSTTIGTLADDWDPSMDFHLLACSGAQTEHLLPTDARHVTNAFGEKADHRFRQVSQLDRGFLDEDTTLVMLSIGGNDAKFGEVILECILLAGVKKCQDAHLGDSEETLGEMIPRLIRGPVKESIIIVLREVHRMAPNAQIALMGYPKLFEADGVCVPGIGTEEAPWLNDMGQLLADHTSDAAAQARQESIPVQFADPIGAFAGKAICGNPETIHAIVVDRTEGDVPFSPSHPHSDQSFHPKISGTRIYAEVLNQTLRSLET